MTRVGDPCWCVCLHTGTGMHVLLSIPTSGSSHRAHCLLWGGDESSPPCSPREVRGPGWWVHVMDWAGRRVLILGRGVGLAQAGGVLSLQPEAALPARKGDLSAHGGGPAWTGVGWLGLLQHHWSAVGLLGGCSRVALQGRPALLYGVSCLPVRWLSSSSGRDRGSALARSPPTPGRAPREGSPAASMGTPLPRSGTGVRGPALCAKLTSSSQHAAHSGDRQDEATAPGRGRARVQTQRQGHVNLMGAGGGPLGRDSGWGLMAR